MNLQDIVARSCPPEPWAEGEKIPWNEPAFSERMLAVHLSQDHDWASRRGSLIEQQIDWIEKNILDGPSRILDLACGPGLYTQRFAERGHSCVGVDFGPASIRYAVAEAARRGLDIDYRLSDIRDVNVQKGFDLVTMIFGEFNVFRCEDVKRILATCHRALRPGGHLLVECHTFEEVERQGLAPTGWHSEPQGGLFSETPHLWLEEHFWDQERSIATTRYFIVDAATAAVTRYASSMQGYTDAQYSDVLEEAGFSSPNILPSLGEEGSDFSGQLQVLHAIRL